LVNASDNGDASADKEDDHPIIKNDINETGKSKTLDRILKNCVIWKIKSTNQIDVIIDSNLVTKGGCPVLLQRITPNIVREKNDRKQNKRANLNGTAFLNIIESKVRKNEPASNAAVTQKKIDSTELTIFLSLL
jgi:hypothetical protein